MGTISMYRAVITPAFPALVYTMPICWRELANPAEDTAGDQSFPVAYRGFAYRGFAHRRIACRGSAHGGDVRRGFACGGFRLSALSPPPLQYKKDWQQHKPSHGASDRIKCERTEIVHANALRHKGAAPDQCSQRQKKIICRSVSHWKNLSITSCAGISFPVNSSNAAAPCQRSIPIPPTAARHPASFAFFSSRVSLGL